MLLMLITAITLPWLPGVFSTEALILRLSKVRIYGDVIRGLLDVRYHGKWGNICYFTFHSREARVACRQLGYLEGNYNLDITPRLEEGVFERVSCNSDESRLDECRLYGGPYRCDHSGLFIRLRCTINPELEGLLNATLLGSTGKMGILEVTSKDGRKAAVCFDSPQNNTSIAKTVCGQMGYSGMQATLVTHQDSYKGNNYMSVFCNGTQPTLASCSMTVMTSCPTTTILGLACKLNMTTQQRFDLRLSPNDSSPNDGTVEVYQYGRWGVICDTGWDMKAAQVVCRQLGFSYVTNATTDAVFGQGTALVFWNNVQCKGDEQSIADCKHEVVFEKGVCHSVNASGVICSKERLPSINICSNSHHTLTTGVTFIQSPNYPARFDYSIGATCHVNLTSPSNFTIYIHNKMFQNNRVEYLSFITSDITDTFYGEDNTQKATTYNTDKMTIKFQASIWTTGSMKLNIQVTAPHLLHTIPVAATTPAVVTTQATTKPQTLGDQESQGSGGAVGGVIGSIIIIVIVVILGISLWKTGFLHFGKRDKDYKTESDAAPTQGEAATPTVIYENLPNRQATAVNEPIYVNSAFVADILSEETAERSGNLGPVESPYADIRYQHSPRQDVTDDSAAPSEAVQEDNVDNDNAGESPYAQLDQVNCSDYLDFRQLRAEQLRPM